MAASALTITKPTRKKPVQRRLPRRHTSPRQPSPSPPTTSPRMTEEEFVRWCDEDVKAEFNAGTVMVMSPVSISHTRLFRRLHTLLHLYAQAKGLGEILGSEYRARLRVGIRRVPDILFVRKEHLNRL